MYSKLACLPVVVLLVALLGIGASQGCNRHQAAEDKVVKLHDDVVNNRNAATAFQELVRLVDQGTWHEQLSAVAALGELGPKALPALQSIRRATNCGNGFVEREAVIALGKVTVGTDLAVDELVTIMFAKRADCSAFAADALGEIGEPARRVLPDLWRAAQSNDESIRLNALSAISRLKGNQEPCCFGTRPSP